MAPPLHAGGGDRGGLAPFQGGRHGLFQKFVHLARRPAGGGDRGEPGPDLPAGGPAARSVRATGSSQGSASWRVSRNSGSLTMRSMRGFSPPLLSKVLWASKL